MEKIASMLEEVMTTQNQFRAEQSMQMNKIQNRIVTLERNNGPKNFQPKQSQLYQRKYPQQEPRFQTS